MPISQKYKCLFIHIPKTGGTSIETALGMHGNWKLEDKEALFGLIQSKELQELGFKSNFLQHLSYKECQSVTPTDNTYTSFSFTRNPWDKMVSIYSNLDNNLVKTAKLQGIDLHKQSFPEFIEKTAYIDHIHLEHQYKFIYNEEKAPCVDFIGRFETLQRDFKILCRKLKIQLELPHKNKSQHGDYRNYYSYKTKKIIEKRYKKDIELFEYTF